MSLLEDILKVLDVTGKEAQRILSDLHQLAESRGGRRLVVRLPRKVREELDDKIEDAVPSKHFAIIKDVIQGNFNETERLDAFKQALEELLEEEFLPTALSEASEEQRRKVEAIVERNSAQT